MDRRLFGVLVGAACAVQVFGQALPPQLQAKQDFGLQRAPNLVSRWVEDLMVEEPFPEYPRPQFVRDEWMNLNGEWEILGEGPTPPTFPTQFPDRAHVPSITQAVTSKLLHGWRRGWYRKEITVPVDWDGKNALLHFEAVGGITTVYFDCRKLGTDRNSHMRFSFQLPPLKADATHEILVYFDDTDPRIPRGIQGVLSGIWKSVWMEPVPVNHIRSFKQTPDIDTGQLVLEADIAASGDDWTWVAIAADSGKEVARATGRAGDRLALPVPNAKLWSPERPFLYDLTLELRQGDRVVDHVGSYFGMRKISTGHVNGVPRILLNNKVYYQTGLLCLGMWPDSNLTPSSERSLKFEIETMKAMGFNVLRKHMKTEVDRWYYWCDKLGMLVWQDLPPQAHFGQKSLETEDDKAFQREALPQMIQQYYNHPSIISWVIFNEGCGQFDPAEMTALAKRYDASRLINTTSHIWPNEQGRERYNSDYYDAHCYERGLKFYDYDGKLPATFGEYGGIALKVEGHLWKADRHFGYGPDATSPEHLMNEFDRLVGQACELRDNRNLCAIIYTQVTDFYNQINGFMTFDREVIKVDIDRMRSTNMRFRAGAGAPKVAVPPAVEKTHAEWKPVEGKIMTRWAKAVSPDNALPEYPRPQMRRDSWMNLNGLWEFDRVSGRETPVYERKILVPFPVESALSGIEEAVMPEDTIHYRRTFTVPDSMRGQRILLHFGAVDWEARVFVNGHAVGSHRGGYAPFHFDVTDALRHDGEQEVHVVVQDPTDKGFQPIGKQVLNPQAIFYNAVSGIWGTVWLEAVPDVYVESLRLTPDIDAGRLGVRCQVSGVWEGLTVSATAVDSGKSVASASCVVGAALTLSIPDAKLWSPDRPFLYDLTLELKKDGKVVDRVDSYFGMRAIKVARDAAGINRLFLNGEVLFQYGTLDQGYWPDGLYTAPTDEALRFDIELVKNCGFNMIRKHIKVEPARWYAHCDRIGLLVWQDMPNRMVHLKTGGDSEDAKNFFREWGEVMDSLYNHPCIVMWVPFNEGWGQFDTEKVVAFTKERDPYRLVNNASGWHDAKVGDVRDVHKYPGPGTAPLEDNRAIVLGEFGGAPYIVKGHQWPDRKWPGKPYPTVELMREAYDGLLDKLRPLVKSSLAAAVYTQIIDVEGEANGFITYDREVMKFDAAKVRTQHEQLIGSLGAAHRPLRIMCLGDSITVGYTDNSIWNEPFKFGYRSRLYTLLKDAGYDFRFVGDSPHPWNKASGDPSHGGTYKPEFDLRDLGQDKHQGGRGTHIPTLKGWLAKDDPDLVLLLIGINGMSTNSPARVRSLVETIVTDNPDAHLIVAQITPYEASRTRLNQLLHDYNVYTRDTLVPEYAARGHKVTTVDMYSLFLTDPADYSSAVAPNKHSNNVNHPYNAEYDLMADRWFEAIEALGLQKAGVPASAGYPHRPNVIQVFIDDMGWGDFSCFGNKDAQTPHIDALASEGIRFEQFYVNSPICSPSRVAISTGTYPQRWGITSFLCARHRNKARGMPNWLDPQAPMLARSLQESGYLTGHFGKWHMGGQRDVTEAPTIPEYGFDDFLTNFEGIGNKLLGLIESPTEKEKKYLPVSEILGKPYTWMPRHQITTGFVDAAIRHIDRAQVEGKPFYLNLWPDDVHSPFYPRLENWGDGTHKTLYMAVLEEMDAQLAKLFNHVKEDDQLRENTIILICSDNGPSIGLHAGKPFKGYKTQMYEGAFARQWSYGLHATLRKRSMVR